MFTILLYEKYNSMLYNQKYILILTEELTLGKREIAKMLHELEKCFHS